jgi:hypothetical protein
MFAVVMPEKATLSRTTESPRLAGWVLDIWSLNVNLEKTDKNPEENTLILIPVFAILALTIRTPPAL